MAVATPEWHLVLEWHFSWEAFIPVLGLNKETYTCGSKNLRPWGKRCTQFDPVCNCLGSWEKLNYESRKFISNLNFQILYPQPLQSFSLCTCCAALVAQLCPTPCDPMNCSPPDSFVHGDSPGKNIGVGCHALLQGIFPTQGLNPGLLHCRWIHHLSHQGRPRILKCVVYPFSRGSSQPRNWTRVSCIVGGFFTSWATREGPASVEPD